MGLTALLPSPLPPRGVAAAAAAAAACRTGCASRSRFDPVCIGSSTAAMATTKKEPKRPGSLCDNEPPTKRHRSGAEDFGAAARGKAAISSPAKDGVNRGLDSLLPLVRSPHEVIPLPNSAVSVLQEKGTRRPCAGGAIDDQIQIKDRDGAAYLRGRMLREEEAESQSKGGVIGKSILSKAAPSKSNPPRAVSKSNLQIKERGEEIEIDININRAIKDRGGVHLGGNLLREDEAPSQSKGRVVGNSRPRSILSKATASKSNPSRAVSKSNLQRATSTRNPPTAAPKSFLLTTTPTCNPLRAVSKSSLLHSASKSHVLRTTPTSNPVTAAPKSILLGTMPTSNPRKAVPKNVLLTTALTSNPSKAALKGIPARAAPSLPAPRKPPERRESASMLVKTAIRQNIPPKSATLKSKSIPLKAKPSHPAQSNPSQGRESVSQLVNTAISQSPPRSTPPAAAPSLKEPPKPMKELLADAKKAMMEIVRRREILKLRAAARWEVEQMVRTVEFNDPYIDYTDVFK